MSEDGLRRLWPRKPDGRERLPAVQLNGQNIKNRSIDGKKLKNNTLTGRQIRESRLGTVPRAREAASLGGLAPNSFVRRDCDETTGQIKGVVTIGASAACSRCTRLRLCPPPGSFVDDAITLITP